MFKDDKNNFNFISEQFEKDNVNLPNALSESSIREKLKDKETVKIKFYRTKIFKRAVSLVACAALVITSIALSRPLINNDKSVVQTPSQSQTVAAFNSYEEIKSVVKKINSSRSFNNLKGAIYNYNFGIKDTAADSAVEVSEDINSSFSQTYTQINDIDEADIIKNDGKYIYYYNDETGILNIYNADGRDTKEISNISDFSFEKNGDILIKDMYVKNNRLILNLAKWEYTSENSDDEGKSIACVYIYDISDIKNPKRMKEFEQSGAYLSSRMIGNRLYFISNFFAQSNQLKKQESYIPYTCEDGSKNQLIKASDICRFENPSQPGYIVVSAIDIETGKKVTDSKAVFGAGQDIYCNSDNLYVIKTDYTGYSQSEEMIEDTEMTRCDSQIIKVSLSEEIEFTASCNVKGEINNQFSLDEKDGFLRVATTSSDKNGKDINNLFVFDNNLKQMGKVEGFAKNESIKSVRYIGDMAYIITYEQTDPLFVIDLSDPKVPEIKGSVKITGFSSQLIPVDENTLLGIGYATEELNDRIITSGIKLALFDISDAENPKVLDSKVFKGAYSEALDNHKALVVNSQKGYYAIPYTVDRYDEQTSSSSVDLGIIKIEIKDGKIKTKKVFTTKNYEYAPSVRCTYTDDYLYTIYSYSGLVKINAYEIN